MKYSSIILLVSFDIFLGFAGCGHNPSGPQTPPANYLSVIGTPGRTKTYYFTNAAFLEGTDTPLVVPPDSLKPTLQFPESLYTRGVFLYMNVVEHCSYNLDTLITVKTGVGVNLFTVVYNWHLQTPSDGSHGMLEVNRYIRTEQDVVYEVRGNIREIVYRLPLSVGDTYNSLVTSAVFRVVGQDTISTPAGSFTTFKVEVLGRWGSQNSETHYVSPDLGIVRSELRYHYPMSVPWDTSSTEQIVEIQTFELLSIN